MRTPHIIRIPILPFHMVNAHLVVGERGAILVDTGLPGSESKIARVMARHGMTFADIELIVVTHAHVDHAGSAARIRELSGAPIVAHEGDLRHFTRQAPMTYCPTAWPGRLFLRTPVPHEQYEAFEPDILLSGGRTLDLERYGLSGTVAPTYGHTAGSVSLELGTKEALVGDLVASGILIGGLMRKGRAIRPPFEDDPAAVGVALQKLLHAGMERFHLGHGGPLGASEVERHARALIARCDSRTHPPRAAP